VIYISFGSMVRSDTLPEEKREAILHSLGKLKQRVLWKWENDSLPNQPPNVFIRKWMPQRDILCKIFLFVSFLHRITRLVLFVQGHQNVRVFMTHGGLLGSSEAAFCGVPVVSTPFYGDQFLNSAAMENRGMGVILKYQDINKDSVFNALRKALDRKMRLNAKKVAYSYTHRPMKPRESAVYWSEYVIATKGAHLTRPYAGDAHWIVYSGLDIYLFVLAVLCTIFGSWIYFMKKLFKKPVPEPKRVLNSRGASMERKIK
jgi:glucuronosyltransferase